MDTSSSTFFNNNAASLIDYLIENNLPVTKFPDSPPALKCTTPLDTPSDCHGTSYFPSPPALGSTRPFYTPSDWNGSSNFPSPPALGYTRPFDTPADWHGSSNFPSPPALKKLILMNFSHNIFHKNLPLLLSH
ncbi:hypothetical protein O181_022118 [Austropuccinia psidii MF-1]|uniref:Uncharacterized protein n=1 Tax=Austropuccinia psidii MF-1 TaxID=1389203 RepID=A0A9Q3CEL0_9BASI|nr:hypothetical protein [Austropuccinia psidii MF-1]